MMTRLVPLACHHSLSPYGNLKINRYQPLEVVRIPILRNSSHVLLYKQLAFNAFHAFRRIFLINKIYKCSHSTCTRSTSRKWCQLMPVMKLSRGWATKVSVLGQKGRKKEIWRGFIYIRNILKYPCERMERHRKRHIRRTVLVKWEILTALILRNSPRSHDDDWIE